MKGTSRKGKGRRLINEHHAEGAGRTAQRGTEKRNTGSTKGERNKKQAKERKGNNSEGERKDSKAMQAKLQTRRSSIELPTAVPRQQQT